MITEKYAKQHVSPPVGLRNRPTPAQKSVFKTGALLDMLLDRLDLKNDAALARELQVAQASLSKLRHGILPVSAAILIRMHESSGMGIRELRARMGDYRSRFGIGD